MSLINLRDRTINAKIVYYGTALSGKTTSLRHIHRVVDPDGRTELVSLNTQGDRTLFFDFLPIPLGSLGGFQVRLQAFTVPGQVKYHVTRRYVLRGADGVVFVADSDPAALEGNAESLEGLRANLVANSLDPARVPLVFQWNKRDVPGAQPVDALHAALNPEGRPEFETTATTGDGVFEALSALCGDILEGLAREYRLADPADVRRQLDARLAEIREEHGRRVVRMVPGTAAAAALVPEAASGAEESRASVIVTRAEATEDGLPGVDQLLEQAVATNIESARLVSELHETRRRLGEHVRQLAVLHETGVVIAGALDLETVLRHVLDGALSTVGATHGAVLLRDVATDQVVPQLVRGFAQDPVATEGVHDADVVRRLLDGAPFALAAAEVPWIAAAAGDVPVAAALVAPLVHQGESLGALVAYELHGPRRDDTDARLRFLGAVAGQASVALANARLYERVEGFNRELEQRVAERTAELERANAELRVLDAAKDAFLASMSHELLTPLTSIGGFAEILADTAGESGEEATKERREFAAIVRRESERLTSTLQSVLSLTALETGSERLCVETLDAQELLVAALRRSRDAFRERGVAVRARVVPALPPVRADRRWASRVLDELLSNACKFAPEATQVVVTVRRGGPGEIAFSIEDRGPGVPESLRERIFERFGQLGDVLTEKPRGLGLGLPIARSAVRALGGRIWVEAPGGGGSCFAFTLPLAETATVVAVRS